MLARAVASLARIAASSSRACVAAEPDRARSPWVGLAVFHVASF